MYDAAIIGGGLTGCATAYFLARAGSSVVVLDSSDVNSKASGANAGSLHVQIPHEPFASRGDVWANGFAPVLPLLLESLDLWRSIEADLGADLEVALTGGLLVATTPAEMRHVERKAALERRFGVETEILSASELAAVAPYLRPGVIGGAFCATEGKANPLACAPAFADAAMRHNAHIRTYFTVRSVARDRTGYVLTGDADVVRARRVVIAAGAGTQEAAALVGLDVALVAVPIQLTVTAPTPPLVPHLVYSASEKLTLKQNRKGQMLIGGGWPARRDRAGRPMVDPVSLARNLRLAADTVPAIGDLQILRSWAAEVNGNESWRPVLGESARAPGVFLAYVPWVGFTASLAAARLVADLALDRAPQTRVDWQAFSPDRTAA